MFLYPHFEMIAFIKHFADETAASRTPGDVMIDAELGTNFPQRFGNHTGCVIYPGIHFMLRHIL